MELTGKIIVITGGGSGIGLAIAQSLSKDNIIISLDRNQEKIARLHEQLPGVESIQTDITEADQLRRALGQIETKYGRIDVLINNAGVGNAVDFQALSAAEIVKAAVTEMRVNYQAPILLTKLALPLLEKATEPVVAFTTSGLAYTPSATYPTYSASKAALHSFVLSLRHQLRNAPIKVVFRLGKKEIGHLHWDGDLDILFTKAVRDQLVQAGLVQVHKWVPDSGWTTFPVASPADAERAGQLLLFSYLQKAKKYEPELFQLHRHRLRELPFGEIAW